jgi:hypothetical protein
MHSHIVRELPDPAVCRTRPIGSIKTFAACLVDQPIGCPNAIKVGEYIYCEHLHWKDFFKQPEGKDG